MPHLDRTGPEGQGPASGRRLGKCSNLNLEEKLTGMGQGMGLRRHAGGGMGLGRRLRSTPSSLIQAFNPEKRKKNE